MSEVRSFWVDPEETLRKKIADKINSLYAPGEGPVIEVIAKQDLQPLVDKLKKAVGYGGEYEFRLFAEEFLVAWEGKNGTE